MLKTESGLLTMTDNEIIKALELCANRTIHSCKFCPCNSGIECNKKLNEGALDLINRQKAEIARLRAVQGSIDNFARDLCKQRILKGKEIADFEDLQEYIKKEKSEAISEFARRLKKKTYPFPCAIGVENAVTIRAINELAEEMEVKNG